MATVDCRVCGTIVEKRAYRCPQCDVKSPSPYFPLWLVALLALFLCSAYGPILLDLIVKSVR